MNQTGFGTVEKIIAACVVILLVVGGVVVFGREDTSEDEPVLVQEEDMYEVVMNEAEYLVVAEAGIACTASSDACDHSVIVQLSAADFVSFDTVATNLQRQGWATMDGEPVAINSGEFIEFGGGPANAFGFTTPNLAGERNYLESEGFQLSFFPFTNEEVQTNDQPYYILESEVSQASSFDFDEVLKRDRVGHYFLNISIRK